MKFSALLFATSLFLAISTSLPAVAQQGQGDTLLLINARILDVESGELADEMQSILIVGNRIFAINLQIEAQAAKVIDLQGKIVLPGLIDLHSHLLLHPYDEATWNDQVLKESLELRTIRGTVAARRTLEAGFTTLRDLGTEGAGFADVALRDSVNQGIVPGPRIFAVTRALVTTGGYGPMGFDPRWEMPIGAQTADGVAECRKVTREQIAAGADWIKIYADYRRRPGASSTPTFSQNELNAIVDEATSAGIPVAAHAATDLGIRRSIKAGVKTIEHGYDASLETLRLMKENNVVLCPTLMASESIARYQGWNPETDPDHPRVTTAKTLIRNALTAGVTIACGSDVGVFTHGDNARELELMFAYGMAIDDVLRSATVTAAQVLEQDDLGQVKENMLADLVVVGANPLEQLSTLRDPILVIKDGKVAFDHQNEAPPEVDLTSLNESSPAIAEQLRNLDMNSSEPQIIDVTDLRDRESGDESGATESTTTDPTNVFVFMLEKDGNFSIDDQPVTKGDLARRLNQELSSDVDGVKVLVRGELDYQKMLDTQNWLKRLEIENVSFEVIDE